MARNYAVLNNTPRLLIETIFIVSMLGYITIYINGGGDVSEMMTTIATFGVAVLILILPRLHMQRRALTLYMKTCSRV